MLDLETFIIMVYVFVDDWYKEKIVDIKPKRGRPAGFTDSEALTLAIVSEWRAGVAWQSERGFLRHMHAHYGTWFPQLPQISAFNERKRRLYGVLLRLQQELCQLVTSADDLYECVDLLPIPAGSSGQYKRSNTHWLWDSGIGYGQGQLFWGDHLLVSVRASGAISGWLLASADIQDRWVLEAFLSGRAGQFKLLGPPHDTHQSYKQRLIAPSGFIGGFAAVGQASSRPYLADKGFNGYRWLTHWMQNYGAQVIAVPTNRAKRQRPWIRSEKLWLASNRQIVETVYAILKMAFDIKFLRVHSRWGQYTRITAKIVGYHLGILFNKLLGRPNFSHETLIC